MSQVHINCMLNPITRELVRSSIPATGKLSDHLNLPDNVNVHRNGVPYNNEDIEDGDVVDIAMVPLGGQGDKRGMARTGLMVVATLAATAAAGPLGLTAAGQLTAWGRVFVGAASFAAGPLLPLNREDK